MKIIAYIKWFLVMLILLIGWLTAKIIYPILYPFRNTWIRNTKPFWFYFDDKIPNGKDYQKWLNGRKETFWVLYLWHAFRNTTDNLKHILLPKKGIKKYVSTKGESSQNGNYNISIYEPCVFKYLDKELNFSWFKGYYLSLKHSVIGWRFVWYKIENTLYWQYSYADKLFWNMWLEIQLGVTSRYIFRFKIKYITKIL